MNSSIEKAKKIDWQHWVDRPYGPFMLTLNMSMADHVYYTRSGLSDAGFGYETSLYQYPIFYYSKDLEIRNTQSLEKYFEKKTLFDLSKSLEDLHIENKKIVADIISNTISTKEKLIKARDVIRTYSPFLWLNISLEKHYQKLIDIEFPKYVTGDIKQFVGEASVSPKKNAYNLMIEMLESNAPIQDVHAKYAWMKSRDGFTDFYTIAELVEIKNNHKKETRIEPSIPKELEGLVSEIRELTFLRTSRTDKMYEMLGLIRPVFEEVAKMVGVSFKELQDYDVDSILSDEKPRKIEKPYSCLFIDGTQIIQNETFVSFRLDSNKEIKGASAFRGIARGPVRVVRHPDDLSKVNAGDVLVAQMTLPSFISAMQKAIAFITDEGGVTCHAAIIAREMKKPAIIGTKIATKVFKDGDMVEVNAEKGIVTILNT
ncbi:MAG: hypothetical protein RIT04_26 [Candidatus Parcubacteria bacterium]|jgi:phosphohistidine swiveling domain-containing protein